MLEWMMKIFAVTGFAVWLLFAIKFSFWFFCVAIRLAEWISLTIADLASGIRCQHCKSRFFIKRGAAPMDESRYYRDCLVCSIRNYYPPFPPPEPPINSQEDAFSELNHMLWGEKNQ